MKCNISCVIGALNKGRARENFAKFRWQLNISLYNLIDYSDPQASWSWRHCHTKLIFLFRGNKPLHLVEHRYKPVAVGMSNIPYGQLSAKLPVIQSIGFGLFGSLGSFRSFGFCGSFGHLGHLGHSGHLVHSGPLGHSGHSSILLWTT